MCHTTGGTCWCRPRVYVYVCTFLCCFGFGFVGRQGPANQASKRGYGQTSGQPMLQCSLPSPPPSPPPFHECTYMRVGNTASRACAMAASRRVRCTSVTIRCFTWRRARQQTMWQEYFDRLCRHSTALALHGSTQPIDVEKVGSSLRTPKACCCCLELRC